MIKVSVIIPTFGNIIFLENAINSVLNQTLKEIELIIVDDNDPDTSFRVLTENIVSNYLDSSIKVTYVKHENNRNGAVARNTGISLARGKYISFLDSDDIYYKDRLEKCYNRAENSSISIAGVYTGCEFRKNKKTYNRFKKIKSGNFLIESLACTFMISSGSNLFIKKDVIEELKGFDEIFLRHQDYEFLVRLFKKYSLVAIPEILLIKNNENFNLPNIQKIIKIKEQFLRKFRLIIDTLQIKDQNYILYSHYIYIAEIALTHKEVDISNRYYKESKKHKNLIIKHRFRKIAFTLNNFIK